MPLGFHRDRNRARRYQQSMKSMVCNDFVGAFVDFIPKTRVIAH
jgi:hypothetical protein